MKKNYSVFRFSSSLILLSSSAIAFVGFVLVVAWLSNRLTQSNVANLIIGIIVVESMFCVLWFAIIHLMRLYVDNELKIRTYKINKYEADIITECHLIETELSPLSFKEWTQINPSKTMSDYYRESKYIY